MSKSPRKTLNIDAGTLLAIASALILIPLLLTGFISQYSGFQSIEAQ